MTVTAPKSLLPAKVRSSPSGAARSPSGQWVGSGGHQRGQVDPRGVGVGHQLPEVGVVAVAELGLDHDDPVLVIAVGQDPAVARWRARSCLSWTVWAGRALFAFAAYPPARSWSYPAAVALS